MVQQDNDEAPSLTEDEDWFIECLMAWANGEISDDDAKRIADLLSREDEMGEESIFLKTIHTITSAVSGVGGAILGGARNAKEGGRSLIMKLFRLLNAVARKIPAVIDSLEHLVQRGKGRLGALAIKLGASGFSIGVGLGLSPQMTFALNYDA